MAQFTGVVRDLERALEKVDRLRTRGSWLKHFDDQLKAIDGQLSLVRATEHANEPGIKPGYWHIKRDNPITLPSFLPIQGPSGEFLEPHSGVLEELRRCDLQRAGALDEIRRIQDREVAQRQKRAEQQKLERVEEMAARMKVIDSPGVSLGAQNWTAKKAGRRGAKR